ncbi:MAG: chemotaxis protein CheW [Burkholderiaceae bacterium]|nr:chemotaxis protein CheW [Pseudomonadota bacterium]MBS0596283.1 chemotaxis protein CheW [Pseudomonadota bacterium]MCO5116341.1 chemotaxis protein CheW [Burkholderiaceae bacterium]MCP5217841.1 chemotaxis protein CheW [Burkholderiaceae bacterium]
MAGKQALREFQTRLAERLQAARSQGVAASWLAVRAGDARLLVPLSHAAEIFSWTDVQRVPYVEPWFMGVANLRGNLSGVVDLAAFLQGRASAPRSALALGQCRLVGFNALLEAGCALLVDELLGMRTTQAFVRSSPRAASDPDHFGHTYTDAQGGQWRELSLQALSQQPAFLEIGVQPVHQG